MKSPLGLSERGVASPLDDDFPPGSRKGPEQARDSSAMAGPPNLLSGGVLYALGSLFYQGCNSCGLRHVDGVAAFDLDPRGARPLRHETLGCRRDHLVFSDDQVPAWLRSPRWFGDHAAECPHAPRDLRVGHESGFFCIHVACKGRGELRLIKEQI